MFAGLGSFAYELEKQKLNYNGHMYSVSPMMFEFDLELRNFWEVTSIHYMPDERPFVASIEAKNYPIFGVQYHPEKSLGWFKDGGGVNRNWDSIIINRHFSELFVGMSRANTNTFGNYESV